MSSVPWWAEDRLQSVDPPLALILLRPEDETLLRADFPEATNPLKPDQLFGLDVLHTPVALAIAVDTSLLETLADALGSTEDVAAAVRVYLKHVTERPCPF